MSSISNVEFMLLQMIAECGQASGYEIKKLVDQRGYQEWAKIGTTSIYKGLKKLSQKGWVVSETLQDKSGKGPIPTRFSLTEAGVTKLKAEILDSLSNTRERDTRFDLGLAALPLIEKKEAINALQKRLAFLHAVVETVKKKYELQGSVQLPLHVRMLFLHPIHLIESERAFISRILHELLEESDKNELNH